MDVNNTAVDTEVNNEFELREVEGINCIVWKCETGNMQTGKKAKSEGKRRKNVKDRVGKEYKNMPMLDSRQVMQDLEYCDIIIYSSSIII
jgi:hypothetical protein